MKLTEVMREDARKFFFYSAAIAAALVGAYVPVMIIVALAFMVYAVNKNAFKFLEGTTVRFDGNPPRVVLD